MLQRLKCECGSWLDSPTSFCMACQREHAIGSGIFVKKELVVVKTFGVKGDESLSFERFDEDVSIRNLYETIAEKLYDRRVREIFISGEEKNLVEEAVEILRNFIFPFEISVSEVFPDSDDFFEKLERFLKVKRGLKEVHLDPERKIHGSHSTIIGGREGFNFLLTIARSPYVKKIVPGVIEGNATSPGGGVRIKLTRSDERGNIRALLIDGSSVQQIYVITTASNREEGEEILKLLKGDVCDLQK